MKKLLLILLCLPLLFTTCKKEDNTPNISSGLVEYDIDCTINGICSLTYINSNGYAIDTLINSDWDLSFYGNTGDTVSLTTNTQNSTIGMIDVKIYYKDVLRANSAHSFNVSSGNYTNQATLVLD